MRSSGMGPTQRNRFTEPMKFINTFRAEPFRIVMIEEFCKFIDRNRLSTAITFFRGHGFTRKAGSELLIFSF